MRNDDQLQRVAGLIHVDQLAELFGKQVNVLSVEESGRFVEGEDSCAV